MSIAVIGGRARKYENSFHLSSSQSMFETHEIPDTLTVWVRHPGFSSEMMSSPDKLKMHVWDILLMCIQSRLGVSFHLLQSGTEHFFTDFITVSMQYLIFSVSIRVDVADAFHEIYDKSERTPLMFKAYPAYVGKTSFNIAVDIYNAATKELLARNFTQLVSVDKETRKSAPLPDWFQDKYRNRCTGASLALPVITKPDTDDVASFVSDIKLPFSDSDFYGHINISSYIKYVIQTAMEASDKGTFNGLFHGGSKMSYRAKTLFIEFLSETKPGSVLTVKAWKMVDGADKQKVHFDLMRQEKKACRAYVEFDEVDDIPSHLPLIKKYENSLQMKCAQSLFEFQECPDLLTVLLRHPGFGAEIFSSPEKLKLHAWDMVAIITICKYYVSYYLHHKQIDHFFADLETLDCNHYSINSQLRVYDAFYDIYDKNSRTPLLFKAHAGCIGKSTYTMTLQAYNAKKKELMMELSSHSVVVDKVTRKPKAFPDWFQNKYRHLCTDPPLIFQIVNKPISGAVALYSTDIKLSYLDADWHGHMNVSSYCKFAIQVAMEATDKGIFKELFTAGSRMNYRAKTVFIEYLAESRPGNIMKVNAWKMESGVNKQKVHFDMIILEKLVCRGYVEFDDIDDYEKAAKL